MFQIQTVKRVYKLLIHNSGKLRSYCIPIQRYLKKAEMPPTNTPHLFNQDFLKIKINETAIEEYVDNQKTKLDLDQIHEIAWLLKAVSVIDLTTLAGNDTLTNVHRLCLKATNPLTAELAEKLSQVTSLPEDKTLISNLTTAAVCVYPSRVSDALERLNQLNSTLPVACVAAGFPSGQFPLHTRLEEIKYCVRTGAKEIDIVLDRSLVLAKRWKDLYDEVKAMKEACGRAKLKTILATGECGSLRNVYIASMVSMLAGSDFIKTSTGKETVNATLPVGVVMCRAIRDFHKLTGVKVGLKPAGGLKSSQDALNWLYLVKQELGDEWLQPSLFRIGASSLLVEIEKRLYCLATSKKPPNYLFKTV